MTLRRVALVSPYALSVYGGVQEQALSMSRELSRRGVEVLLVAPDGLDRHHYDTPALVRTYGPLLSLPANGSRAPLTLSPGAARAARATIDSFSPDVVHLHEPFAPLLGYDVLRTHAHASVGTFHRSGGGPAVSLTKPLLRALKSGLDQSVAVSAAAAATARAGSGIECEVLFNGFETERFREFAPESNDETVIFFVGRLEERKGVMTLLRAAQLHRLSGARHWRVVVAGDGPLREELVSANSLDPAIEILGAVDDETKRRWQRRADVVVAASTHGESFGLVVLEAMAAETRVVVSDIDGYRQAAGGHGVLFRPSDPEDLVLAIERALDSRDASTIESAREHAEAWSMSRLIDRYLEIYEAAIIRRAQAR